MNIKQLVTLRAVQRYRSVNAAATALFLSPSAVSQQLQSLAATCGFAVVERAGRGIRLTERGRHVAELGEEILTRWENALASIRGLPDDAAAGPARPVRLGAFTTAYRTWLLPALRKARTRTGISFELYETGAREAYESVASEQLDLAVVIRLPHLAPEPLISYALFDEPLALVAPPKLARSAAASSLTAFADADWALPNREMLCHEVILGHCAGLGFRPRAIARSSDWHAVQEMAALLGAAALVPASCWTAMEGLVRVDLPASALPALHIELTTRAPIAVTPWFTALHREMIRLSAPATTDASRDLRLVANR